MHAAPEEAGRFREASGGGDGQGGWNVACCGLHVWQLRGFNII